MSNIIKFSSNVELLGKLDYFKYKIWNTAIMKQSKQQESTTVDNATLVFEHGI